MDAISVSAYQVSWQGTPCPGHLFAAHWATESPSSSCPHLSSCTTVHALRVPPSSSVPPTAAKPSESAGFAHHASARTGCGSSCQQGSKGRCVWMKASGGRKKGSGWSRAALRAACKCSYNTYYHFVLQHGNGTVPHSGTEWLAWPVPALHLAKLGNRRRQKAPRKGQGSYIAQSWHVKRP